MISEFFINRSSPNCFVEQSKNKNNVFKFSFYFLVLRLSLTELKLIYLTNNVAVANLVVNKGLAMFLVGNSLCNFVE